MTGESPEQGAEPRPTRPSIPRMGAVASGIVSALLAASLVLVFPFGLFIAPLGLVPVVHFAASGRPSIHSWGWVAAGLAALTLSAGGGYLGVILAAYLVVVAIPATATDGWWRFGWDDGRWSAVATLVGAALILLLLGLVMWPSSPVEGMAAVVQERAPEMVELYQSAGMSRGDVQLAIELVEKVVSWAFPSFVVAYLVVVLFWIRPRLAVLRLPVTPVLFERYRSDEWLPAAFAVSGLATVVLSGTSRWVALNLLIAVLILYFVHGLAIIRAHLARWIGRGWLVRWGVALVSLQMPLPVLVAALGLTDSFYRLRPEIDGGNDEGDSERLR